MQFKQISSRPLKQCFYILLSTIILSNSVFSQSTYLSQGAKENIIIDRLEIIAQKDSILNFSKTRPVNRQHMMQAVMAFKQKYPGIVLSKTDEYNLNGVYLNNIEYIADSLRGNFKSKKKLGPFYTTPANLYEVHVKDFDLVVNPIIQFKYMKESDNGETLFLNSRGVTIRGRIAN